jgi:hypothetical protein
LVYIHSVDLDQPGAYIGASTPNCYGVAHGYGTATHSYSTPCLSRGRGENDQDPDNAPVNLNMHGDY